MCFTSHLFTTVQNSCCLGGLAKQKSVPNRSLRIGQRSSIAQSSKSKRRRWSSRPEEMENNTSIPHSLQAHVSSGPATANEDATISEENGNSSSFVNQGLGLPSLCLVFVVQYG